MQQNFNDAIALSHSAESTNKSFLLQLFLQEFCNIWFDNAINCEADFCLACFEVMNFKWNLWHSIMQMYIKRTRNI